MIRHVVIGIVAAGTCLIGGVANAQSGEPPQKNNETTTQTTTQAKTQPDLRPTFMGTAYTIEGGEFDGKRGFLFRVWNRSGRSLNRRKLPGRFNKRRKVLGYLATGAAYSDGTLSWEGRDTLGEVLFVDGERERLNPSPTGEFADRPANFIVVVEPEVDQIVYTLQGRTATASWDAATQEVLDLGGSDEDDGLPPDPGEAGKATLEGIDSNGNGVRDDVERAIAKLYPDEPELRALQMAAAIEAQTNLVLGVAGDREALVEHLNTKEARIPGLCLMFYLDRKGEPFWKADNLARELRVVILNTKQRMQAYDGFNKLLSGSVINGIPFHNSGEDYCSDLGG